MNYDQAKAKVFEDLAVWPGDMFEYSAAVWRVNLYAGAPMREVVMKKVGSDHRIILAVYDVWNLLNCGMMKRV